MEEYEEWFKDRVEAGDFLPWHRSQIAAQGRAAVAGAAQ